MHGKEVIYTALFGDLDRLLPPDTDNSYYSFGDHAWPGWIYEGGAKFKLDNRRAARYYKTHPHLTGADYEYIIWVDASITLTEYGIAEINKWMEGEPYDIYLPKHPYRGTCLEEGRFCGAQGVDTPSILARQIQEYEDQGFPDAEFPLGETNILIRRNNLRVMDFNDIWWEEINRGSCRDQVSFGYALWKSKATYKLIDLGPSFATRTHPIFRFRHHRR